MHLVFPPGTSATVIRDYRRPHDDPISGRSGETIFVDDAKTGETDIVGWTWCRAADGREGWVPDAWTSGSGSARKLKRDYCALELSVRAGERVSLELSESGFVRCRTTASEVGWLPDAILELDGADIAVVTLHE